MTLVATKELLRRQAKIRRQRAREMDDGLAPIRLLKQLRSALATKTGMVVAGYWPIGSEMDIRPVMDKLRAGGCVITLPCVEGDDRPLRFRVWRSGEMLVREKFGAFSPPVTAQIRTPDVILTPLLAFDRCGGRLGYGGGFYDRSLAVLKKGAPSCRAIGVAWAAQEIPVVPVEAHDRPLDMIVTEEEVIQP